MTTWKQIQLELIDLGFDVGPAGADGLVGPASLDANMQLINAYKVSTPKPSGKPDIPPAPTKYPHDVIPAEWLPFCHMQRIIVHWTAGGLNASSNDLSHYHILIEGDGKITRGSKSIKDNLSTQDGVYAAHTQGCNTQSIGVSLCGMVGAVESPFSPGNQPINKKQWTLLPKVLAQLCRQYAIPITRQTVLSHAEVQGTLGIKQNGKWDIAELPWPENKLHTALAVGDNFRSATQSYFN